MSKPQKRRQFTIKIECEGEYIKAEPSESNLTLADRVKDFFAQTNVNTEDNSVMQTLLNFLQSDKEGTTLELEINSSKMIVTKINFLSNDEYDDNSYSGWD